MLASFCFLLVSFLQYRFSHSLFSLLYMFSHILLDDVQLVLGDCSQIKSLYKYIYIRLINQ